MNEMIAQLLAQQMGTPENGGADPMAALNLAQDGDPMMAMIASMMQQNQNQAAETSEIAVYKRKLARAYRAIKALRGYAESAQVMLQYIAEVFGACNACWGQDETCPECHGRGTPGSRQPNREELLHWVAPALKSLNLRVVHQVAAQEK